MLNTNNVLVTRMLTGWSFIRFVYLAMGSAIMLQSLVDHQWIGAIMGGYFTSMAVFNYGCATGGCYSVTAAGKMNYDNSTTIDEVDYEEIRGKQLKK